jgi:hypothetical protein
MGGTYGRSAWTCVSISLTRRFGTEYQLADLLGKGLRLVQFDKSMYSLLGIRRG